MVPPQLTIESSQPKVELCAQVRDLAVENLAAWLTLFCNHGGCMRLHAFTCYSSNKEAAHRPNRRNDKRPARERMPRMDHEQCRQ